MCIRYTYKPYIVITSKFNLWSNGFMEKIECACLYKSGPDFYLMCSRRNLEEDDRCLFQR